MLRVVLICLALLLGLGPLVARADVGTITDSGTFTQVQQGHFVPLYYPSVCSVVISGTNANIDIEPAYSINGGRTMQAATSINGGVITANGTYTGTIPFTPSQNVNGFSLFQTGPSMTGTANYTVTCTATNGAFRAGTQAGVLADGSGAFAVTYSSGLITTTNAIVVTPSAYSGADNAIVACRVTTVSLTGFSGVCAGGVSASTVTLYYMVNGT